MVVVEVVDMLEVVTYRDNLVVLVVLVTMVLVLVEMQHQIATLIDRDIHKGQVVEDLLMMDGVAVVPVVLVVVVLQVVVAVMVDWV